MSLTPAGYTGTPKPPPGGWPTGPAPGASHDGLTAHQRAELAAHAHDVTTGIRLRCLDLAERLDPFGSVRRRLAERDGTEQPDPVTNTIALARRLEAYVLGQCTCQRIDTSTIGGGPATTRGRTEPDCAVHGEGAGQ